MDKPMSPSNSAVRRAKSSEGDEMSGATSGPRRAASEGRALGRRIWRFAGCELDESRWRLSVHGEVVDLEIKPLELLLELLRRPGEVLTKDELMEAVWPATIVVEGSLTTAISKLRKALKDDDQTLLVTAPRIGYRLAASVETAIAEPQAAPDLALKEGQAAPGRPQWRLVRPLGPSRANEVWLAEHEKTGEPRVFKFANDASFLRNLKREVAISRLIHASLGERADFAPALEWNFAVQPFFVEIAYRGQDLPGWALARGGIGAVTLSERLNLAGQVAATVASAHELGVLHQDLKPANVVVSGDGVAGWKTAVVDFGNAEVVDAVSLVHLNITYEELEPGSGSTGGRGGTPLYLAPERLAGAPPSVRSDIYSLGVMLYQLTVGDLSRPLAAGWENDIADPLLREDIAAAASGDVERRLANAGELAERLKTLEARRQARAEAQVAAERSAELEKQLARARVRRPWVIAAVSALAFGIMGSTALYAEARHERDMARRQSRIAEQINLFLANDLLARSNPFKSGKTDETLVSAVTQAAPQIDRRFPTEPDVAARLHGTIARALDRRDDWDEARREYQRAAELWRRAEGPASVHAHIANLQQAMMEARTYKAGSLEAAKAIVAREEPLVAKIRAPGPELPVWLASARGMIALVSDDAREAAKQFDLAYKGAEADPADFDIGQRLTFLQRLAFSHVRLGEGPQAEALFRRLANAYGALEGPEGANVLQVRLNLAQALMIQGKYAASVAEADVVYPKLLLALGPDHQLTLQALSTRAQSHGAQEHWDAAIADTEKVHAVAVRTVGASSFYGIASLTDGATAKCRAGRLDEGLRDIARARAAAHAGFAGSALEMAVDFTWAECLILGKRFGEAETHLTGIKPEVVAQLAADPDWGAGLDVARAEIALSRGDKAAARPLLSKAAKAMTKPTAGQFERRRYGRLMSEATS
jgi:eukaryotic-like serine/threonine-protein kinase